MRRARRAGGPVLGNGENRVRIVEVATRKDLKRFVQVPRHLYSGLAGFEPSLDFERMQLLDPKRAPFFGHGEAAFWLALDAAGRPLGRISAQYDRLTPPERAHIGHFGCLEAVDEGAVVAALIATARDWHARRGRRILQGPYTFSINEEAGLQVEGQEHGAMILMPWHPPYLGAHVEAAGLVPVKDLLAYVIDLDHAAKWRGMTVAKASGQGQMTTRMLDLTALDREAELMTELFNASWNDNWGFVPLAAPELATLLKVSRPILRANHATFIEVDGKVSAFAFGLPNAYELFRGLNGRLLPFNWARAAYRLLTHRFDSYRFTLLGVRSDLRDTTFGARLPMAAIAQLFSQNRNPGSLEMSWILDDNTRMRRIIERIGGKVYKRYRLYGDAGPASGGVEAPAGAAS